MMVDRIPRGAHPLFRMRKATTTAKRLNRFLAAHPNASRDYSLSDIARRLDISRERVRQLLPEYARQRPARSSIIERELSEFIAQTPTALHPTNRGGPSFTQIATEGSS